MLPSLSFADLDHIGDPRLRDLARYWLDARGESATPPVTAIDPAAFPGLLADVWMCDIVENDPAGRWRYRLIGSNIRIAYGRDIVGETLEELTNPGSLDRIAGYFAVATDRPAIVHVAGRIYAEVDEAAAGERLILPFRGENSDRTVRLLGATLHSWWARGAPQDDPPARQVRTFTPVDGSPSWVEDWL